MIQVENLTKYYGETLAVDNVSFEIQQGQIVGFLGPNGAGKTTTMRMLTGYLLPTNGTAKILGRDIIEDSLEVRKTTGYLPEMNPIYEDMTVPEYLEFIGLVRKIDKHNLKKRIKEVIELCGLKEILHQNIGELSRGYKQRVGFACAIFHNPDVLILDEPTSGLDPNQTREVRELIKELKKEKTVIISTHILPEVQAICDRVLIINRGKIVADGTTKELESMVQGKGRERVYLEVLCPEQTEITIINTLRTLQTCENVFLKDKRDNIFCFEIESQFDLREQIFNMAVKNNWTIIELHRQTLTLEEIFRQLTM